MPIRTILGAIWKELAAAAAIFLCFRDRAERACFYIVLVMLNPLVLPFEYWAVMSIQDSTDYFLQEVDSAKPGEDGREYIYVGDDLHVAAYNWRHRAGTVGAGSCLIWVERNRENVGGKFDGERHVMQALEQQFPMDGAIRRTSWPLAPARIQITEDWFDDPSASEQEMDIFTTGYYNCHLLDKLRISLGIPRMHHNALGDPERERSRVVLRRR